jgi:1-acyl-sn-glycerol-3-phosphate acyltransferase
MSASFITIEKTVFLNIVNQKMKIITGILSFLWKCYVGIVFSVVAVLLYPIFLVLLSTKKWKKISFRVFVFWSWIMRIFCFYTIKKITNHAPPKGPYILIANHASYLDIFFMYSLFPKHPFLFLGKGEILSYPIIRTYFKNLNIPVHRTDRIKSAESFGLAKKAVREGWSLVIFPEGGIPDTNRPNMMAFKKGAFKLAKTLNVPLVPITFTNHHLLFSDPMDLLGPARPGISHVYIHPFLSTEKIQHTTEAALLQECYDTIEAPLLKEYPFIERN